MQRDRIRLAVPPATSRAALHLMMVLTFVTGVVDAVGFLALDRVFVGNMTGNIVILGMAVAGADDLPVLGPVIALVTFSLGAYLAGLFLRHRRKEWGGAVTLLLSVGAVTLAVLGAAFFVEEWAQSHALELVASSLTAAAMGVQAAVARSLAVTDMTTVVVTSTLTSLAGESLVDQGVKGLWTRRFAAIAAIFLGALIGALLLAFGPAVPLLLAALLTALVVIVGHRRLFAPRQPEQDEQAETA
ncbi:MAG: YoaK family protein [Leucobacter sp.]